MDDKIIVRRANVVLEVPADEKSSYISQGYSVLDAAGNVIEEALPNDVNTLRIMVSKLQKEIAELKKAAEKPAVKDKPKTSAPKKSADK